MPFSNQQYLYERLPSRYRREDKDLFLKRFLQFFGETLDGYDATFDLFFESVNPNTAADEWINFWLENLFGWSWFPAWFTLAQKRSLYANFARHLARRGTRRGIELFLQDFGVTSRVHARAVVWGETVWGESAFAISEPLRLVVEILQINAPKADFAVWGEGAFGEFYYAQPKAAFAEKELLDLIRFEQPQAQEIVALYPRGETIDEFDYWRLIQW